MEKDEELLNRLIPIFRIEAAEHISSISSGLFWLQNHTSGADMQKGIENIYRSFHSLKGSSALVNYTEMESLCQTIENLLSMLKKGEITFTGDILNQLIDSGDLLNEMLAGFEHGLTQDKLSRVNTAIERISRISGSPVEKSIPVRSSFDDRVAEPEKESAAPQQYPVPEGITEERRNVRERRAVHEQQPFLNLQQSLQTETIRIPASRLESVMVKAEEFVSFKLAARHYAAELAEIKNILSQWYRDMSGSSEDVKKLFIIDEEITDNKSPLSQGCIDRIKEIFLKNNTLYAELNSRVTDIKKIIVDDSRSSGTMIDDLLIDMKGLLLMPFSSVFETFPKLVRDISREQGKEVDLILEGAEIEIDRRVLQEMKDPFIHLIRNSIDHGIESADYREQTGKGRLGRLGISVIQLDGGKIEVIISDDGAGIDPEKVRTAAVKEGIISAEKAESMTEDEITAMIFESGISTSPMVTTVSGRGLGMAIVREKAELLGGSVTVKSVAGKGTLFRLVLPVNIATFRGILITTGGYNFVVPTKNVERMIRVSFDDVKTVENMDTVLYGGYAISLVSLSAILGLPVNRERGDDYLNVMIIPAGSKYMAFSIDGVLNEGEMLMKTLGKQLLHVRNISGATILASGAVVPVLNAVELVKTALKTPAGTVSLPQILAEKRKESARKSILVVEDSITARSLYVNILESAGYTVSPAVDGVDGFTRLINGNFDLVLTDVQMPKMNGFELTAKIRNDQRFASMPVILVTGLESADDKKKGIDAGANAYIVKSSFDQNNLLDVIRRFI